MGKHIYYIPCLFKAQTSLFQWRLWQRPRSWERLGKNRRQKKWEGKNKKQNKLQKQIKNKEWNKITKPPSGHHFGLKHHLEITKFQIMEGSDEPHIPVPRETLSKAPI